MRASFLFLALTVANSATVALSSVLRSESYTSTSHWNSLSDYLGKLTPVAKDVLVNRIAGPAIGADPGVLITVLPEAGRPDYNIFWLRDALLAYHAWFIELVLSPKDKQIRALVDDYVHALIRTQHVVNIAGNTFSGGLEEALFDLQIGVINNPNYRIGSPAADGPPFRALFLIEYAEWLLQPEQRNGTWVADVLWPAIDLDLQWISLHWNQSSWDLWWAPVWAGSYWTSSLQYRALVAGARLSRTIGRYENTPGYDKVAPLVLDYLQESRPSPLSFWNEKEGYMTETTITNVASGGRSGIGAAPLTVSVINFDPTLGCDSATFQPCSDRALSSLKVVGDAFKELFPINQQLPSDQSPYFGFFLEDQLYGGHVQYFATFNIAEQIFDALITWDLIGSLSVTKVSLKFFQQFDKRVKIGTYEKHSHTYKKLTSAMRTWAENTLISLEERTPPDFVLPLIMNKTTGEPVPPGGALRSQVAVLGSNNAYHGGIPPSWAHGGGYPKNGPKKSPINEHDCNLKEVNSENQFGFGF
ncbi:Six-hairpin glycosidase-like protein [Lactarius quietus]|nr:Six-hairpin glycosidase-like protein [Lactarius quietus]